MTDSGYGDHDRERRVPEAPKDPGRGDFARDRARVVHSSALRRLAAKTQVVDPGSDDFTRTRLTHSLEVAQVGRELGAALGCDPDVVDTACLAHDLGHPPFGHNGEAALDALTPGGFEGNAQTLRVLTRLEPKVLDAAGRGAGLNLTRASLDAVAKYPWPRAGLPAGAPAGKYGVYEEDLAVFGWLRARAPQGRRCLEAQVMDLSDDIAYSVHDVEDAVVAGRVDPALLGERETLERVAARARSWYVPDADPEEVVAALARLRAMPAWVGEYDGSLRAQAALKDLTSQLVGRFVRAAEGATREAHGAGPLSRYGADLVVPRATWLEITTLKAVAAEFVMAEGRRLPAQVRQRELLSELVAVLTERAPDALDAVHADSWRAAGTDPARARAVVDQVASLTDGSALAWHARLVRARPGGASAAGAV